MGIHWHKKKIVEGQILLPFSRLINFVQEGKVEEL